MSCVYRLMVKGFFRGYTGASTHLVRERSYFDFDYLLRRHARKMLSGNTGTRSSLDVLGQYLRRLIHYPQMDIEYTLWQMFQLCFNPKKVYNTTRYRKQTKNQWARDDPAFVALTIFFLAMASLSYAIAFHGWNFGTILKLVLWSIFVEYLVVGIVIATLGWWLSNKYLRVNGGSVYNVEQTVEWLYAFDIHCNSFFPLYVLIYVVQFFLIFVLTRESFVATFCANTLYLISFSYYHYITFLGYTALPFLHKTVYFLYPIGLLLLGYFATLFFNFNCTIFVMNIYFGTTTK
jgi:hypothetical protein